jgi:DNA-binding response OmpR family regulator
MVALPLPALAVLVVEDDDDLRSSLVLLLVAHGFRAAGAADGLEALSHLRAHGPPGLIVLDAVMPGMGGLEFRGEQLADPALAGIPVVVCTAWEELQDRPEFRAVAAFLVKPADPRRLLGLVREHCRRAGD